jgi:integrase
MACISRDPNGHRRILFVASDGKRMTIRLGKVSQRDAESVKVKVEHMVAAVRSNLPLDSETASWLANIGDDLASKLAAVGLTRERATATLGPFLDSYIARRTDVKPNTNRNLIAARDRLVEYFGDARPLKSVTPGDADAWLLWLRERYASGTAGRTVKRAKQFFRSALRSKLIAENPFEDVKPPSQVNPKRAFFVTRDMATQILDACNDNEWRLIFVLSRYAGLRCPSEHLRLRWEDIDWERGRMLIRAPKKEHFEDGGERWIPIFPEVKPYLEQAFEDAEPGAVDVVTRYRDAGVNLRTRLLKTIKRAGLVPWPKLFQNLRASRETELVASHPLHVVCSWIGNSAIIAQKHYLQVRDEDFDRAQGGAESGSVAAQNAAQHAAARSRTDPHESTKARPEPGFTLVGAAPCETVQCTKVPPRGLEPLS